jgi:membrane-associated phospholipid phosphatase
VALAISAFLILRQIIPARAGRLYRIGVASCFIVPAFTAFQRIAGGRHFLSDSLLSAMFVVVIALLLQALLFRNRT